ncbi:MAG TPA: Nif3-like dinuclear metal center hexameric protein [Pirellulales bacterium]|nr:Nif3-like dinuclear metal center hexameric protein [Pirellulales bacterium]
MLTVSAIAAFLEDFAPHRLAAEWDNVGLLVGDAKRNVQRIMTCLTVTPHSVQEAVSEKAELIVAHHPFPFREFKRISADTTEGRMLLEVIEAGIAVYSPHTAFDSARSGINQRLAEGLGLSDVGPLVSDIADPKLGAGRYGFPEASATLGRVATRLKDFLNLPGVHLVGNAQMPVRAVAVACGSGGELLEAAHRAGCDCFVTGETRFHTCLAAEAMGMGLILAGHFASERFAVERLAEMLAAQFPAATVWPCRAERDPVQWV